LCDHTTEREAREEAAQQVHDLPGREGGWVFGPDIWAAPIDRLIDSARAYLENPGHDMSAQPATSTAANESTDSTEARVLQEAARLFRKRGYEGTSIRELASAVGIQSATLYHYMKTKEAVLAAVCDRGYELIISAVTEAATGADTPLDALRAIIRAHLEVSIEHRDFYVTALTEVRSLSSQARRRVERDREDYADLLEKVLTEAQDRGQVRTDISAEQLVMVLRNQLSWTLFWFSTSGEMTIDELSNLMFKVFVEGASV
jgi:AcrR family transcriptional regulator